MSIIQISKIQQRSGNLVDLPQLDEAELGFASDEKKLFIGRTTGNIENVEVLTAYSDIAFSQIDGAWGNLDINSNVGNGEVLTFNGVDWTNRGGNTGGYINLGNVSNVSVLGGSAGYQLTTDGYGNLSWEPKGFVVLPIVNVTNDNPATIEFSNFFPLAEGTQITVNNIQGNTDFTAMNATVLYLKVISGSSTEYLLYNDTGLISPYDTTSFNSYPYTAATQTTYGANNSSTITVADSQNFTTNLPVMFQGITSNSGIETNRQYYIFAVLDSTHIRISTSNDGNISNVVSLNTTSITANVYASTGTATIAVGTSGTAAAGSNTQVQFNNVGTLAGDVGLTYDQPSKTLTSNSLTVTNALSVGTTITTTSINVSSTITATNITTGSSGTAGTITGNWTLTSGSKLQSTYADLAEYYAADNAYTSGTVLEFGGSGEVTLAGVESNKIAGVVSQHPAYIMNGNLQATFPVIIALIGRVPVQVTGTINKGDMLVSAGNGYAKAASDPKMGTVIGKAIENKISEEPGLVEVMVGRL